MQKKASRRRHVFQAAKEVRKLARQQVGRVPPARTIEPKTRRKKPKHPRPALESWLEG